MTEVKLPQRRTLIKLCEDGLVPQKDWGDRDSAGAQLQLGQARVLLLAGCYFKIIGEHNSEKSDRCVSDEDTWWVEIYYEGFGFFEYGEPDDRDDHTEGRQCETFYIPTRKRLNAKKGKDWY